jgi:hypothetical protein
VIGLLGSNLEEGTQQQLQLWELPSLIEFDFLSLQIK